MINLMITQFNENNLKIKDTEKTQIDDKDRNELLIINH